MEVRASRSLSICARDSVDAWASGRPAHLRLRFALLGCVCGAAGVSRRTGRRGATTGVGVQGGRGAAAAHARFARRSGLPPATMLRRGQRRLGRPSWRCVVLDQLGHGRPRRRRRRARSTRRRRPSARPRRRRRRPAARRTPHGLQPARRRRREGALGAGHAGTRGSPSSSRGAGARSRSRARPPTAASSSASQTTMQAVSRAAAVRRRFSRARASSERVVLDGRVQPARDLLVREPVDRAHHQHATLAVGQAVDVTEQRAGLGAVARARPGQRARCGGHAVELDVTGRRRRRGAAQLVEAGVVDEPQQPGARLQRHHAGAQGAVHAQEHVLQHVVGIVAGCAQHPPRLPAQHGTVALELARATSSPAAKRARSARSSMEWRWGLGRVGRRRVQTRAPEVMCRLFSRTLDVSSG